jgi:hypothetical protein
MRYYRGARNARAQTTIREIRPIFLVNEPPSPVADLLAVDPRIVGGDAVDSIDQYPFIVSLQSVAGRHRCGGSVLSKHVVLTAGHCGYNFQPGYMLAVVGRRDLTDTSAGIVIMYVPVLAMRACGLDPHQDCRCVRVMWMPPLRMEPVDQQMGSLPRGALPVKILCT